MNPEKRTIDIASQEMLRKAGEQNIDTAWEMMYT